MKKFLVPTDFSETAHNAFITALSTARHFNAEVILMSVYDQPHTGQSVLRDISDQLEQSALQDLDQEVKRVKDDFADINISVKAVKGETIEMIHRVAEVDKVDLIVMGKTGRSGFSNKVFGSIALGLIDKSDHPVMLVPQEWSYKDFTKICLASDFSEVDYDQVLQPLVTFSKRLEVPVDIIHFTSDDEALHDILIDKPKEKDAIKKALNDIPHYFVFGAREDVGKALYDFVNNRNFHMMCMIKHEYPWLKKIFTPSPTVEAAIHIKIPLLILR